MNDKIKLDDLKITSYPKRIQEWLGQQTLTVSEAENVKAENVKADPKSFRIEVTTEGYKLQVNHTGSLTKKKMFLIGILLTLTFLALVTVLNDPSIFKQMIEAFF